MGVNVYILDRRTARLDVGGTSHAVGWLRRSWKITELNAGRTIELEAAKASARSIASPPAAMLADVADMPLGSADGPQVSAHLVIGWDEGRTIVTDMGWDYLPVLGYGVRDAEGGGFALHEERDGALHPIGRERAAELGLAGPDGRMVRHGQPTIAECRSVRRYVAGYAEADCTFDDGRTERLLVGIEGDGLPDPSWLVGRKPRQAERYPA
jgi:hypothetical protein